MEIFGQQSVYVLGIVNLFLAGIAIVCVVQAEEHPEYFSLVYIAVSIFIFYMGTILIIIVMQIIETCQEQGQQQDQQEQDEQQENQPSLEIQISPQLNAIHDKKLTIPKKTAIHMSRSQTLPLSLSLLDSHYTSSIAALSSTLKDLKNTSNEFRTKSSHLILLPKGQQTFSTSHKNYQSFAYINSNDQHCRS